MELEARQPVRGAIGRAAFARVAAVASALALACACAACATEGAGSNPPLPGGPTVVDDGDSGGDGGSAASGDDGAPAGDEASPAASDDGGCNDLVHSLRALFAIPPMACATSTDCPPGDCCFVSSSASACVMQ